jgi:hypothetical protein
MMTMPRVTDWSREFEDPIPLPKGKTLATLRDAALYITKLPKAEHDAEEWQAAMESVAIGGRAWRADDVCADRRNASVEPARRAGVRQVTQGSPLGKTEAGAGSMTKAE